MSSDYRLVSYVDGVRGPSAGVLIGERVVPATSLLQNSDVVDSGSVLGLLRAWDVVHPRLHSAAHATRPGNGIALSDTKLLAPIQVRF